MRAFIAECEKLLSWLLERSTTIVEWFNAPLIEHLDSVPDWLIGLLPDGLETFLGETTVLTFMLGSGLTIYLTLVIFNFFRRTILG